MNRILAIDPGTACGYAFLDISAGTENKPSLSQAGLWDLSTKRHEGGGMRFLRLKKHITEIAPDLLVYEEVASHKGTAAAHIYGGIISTLQTYCCEYNVPYYGVPVGTIKKRATGKGNSGKPAMIEAANKAFRTEYDEELTDDNIADALWILQIGVEEYGETLE